MIAIEEVQAVLRHAAKTVGGRFSLTTDGQEDGCYIIHYVRVGSWPHEDIKPVGGGTYEECLRKLYDYVEAFERHDS